MILELVAGRIVAPYVGVSLYTWTTIIGIVLAGISLGNYGGGRLADRWASLPFLGGIFLVAGLSCFGVLLADQWSDLLLGQSIIINILVLTTVLFFLPCVILGTVSPIVAKLAVRDLSKTGSVVGKIYAFGALGSIVGTFATGFVLISWFGTYPIVWGVAVLLLVMGLLLGWGNRWRLFLIALLMIAAGSALLFNQGGVGSPCTRETNYFCIKVQEEKRDNETVRVLILDRLVHSYTSLDNPTKLVYSYEKMYAEITAYQAQHHTPLRALFIGGGGYTFPRYMEALYPDSRLDVIEIDPGVTQIAHDLLGLSRETNIVTYNQDARLFLAKKPTPTYYLIMGDAFNDFSVPYHLTTQEFNQNVRGWLADGGLYVVNIIDGVQGNFLRAYTHTLRQTFAYVYLAPTLRAWRESPRCTYVLIAGDTPLNLATLKNIDAGDGEALLARQMLAAPELEAVLNAGRVVKLTDEYAPVDQLLAPVVRGEEN